MTLTDNLLQIGRDLESAGDISSALRVRVVAIDLARLERFANEVVTDAAEDELLRSTASNVVDIRHWRAH